MPIKNNKLELIIIILLIILYYKIEISTLYFYNSPLVSIIIPESISLNITYNCINSILKEEQSLDYEIILINETLADEIKFLIKNYSQNHVKIFLHKAKEINNFLRNCNQAAKNSRGKYILFLRDNTKVYKNWLSFLLKEIKSNEKIGIVGSKLIYSNGTLLEAGGIMWNNGEYTNYGKGKSAYMPEYNYIKEVDFVSGVSFIIKKSVWQKIGGFDEKFIHKYYEDIDLSFTLRKNGYKILYQPQSLVEYYESISLRKNNQSNMEKKCKKKFLEKWENELKIQLDQNNTFMARDRSINKSRILVVDRFVPNFDKDAGGRFCFMYLNIFKEIGLQVTFLGDDPKIMEPYTSILQQNGIEVLYGNTYKKEKLKSWLKDNLKYFRYIYLQRPGIAIKYIYLIKNYSSAKIFYFAHDLHYIRLSREFKITHQIKLLKASRYMKRIEKKIFKKVDIIHIVGNYEYNILKKEYKNKIIRNIPLYIYDKQPKMIEKNFLKRRNLIFVGGFLHSPNIDAILWFTKEIFPKIIKKFPDIILHLIGSKIPNIILKLKSKNIKIIGYLSDEELHIMYQKCRLAIAPLRFGAGIKGKIVEAAYNQIPMVTTTIGGEGIDNSIGAFIMEDNPEKMANLICQLYTDYSKLKQMSNNGKILIEKYFSKKKAKEIIMSDINS